MKFKIGDKVKVVKERTRSMNPAGKMDKYLGNTVTIADVFDSNRIYKIKEDNGEWIWYDEVFEPDVVAEHMIDCSKIKNYFSEKYRMSSNCEISCAVCKLSEHNNKRKMPCGKFEREYTDEAIEIVQVWSDAHPKEKHITNRDKFKEIFGKTKFEDKNCVGCVRTVDPCSGCEWWGKEYKETNNHNLRRLKAPWDA